MTASRNDDPPWEGIEVQFEAVGETRRARDTHWCCACVKPIRRGQLYTRVFAVVDDEPQVQKFHGIVVGACVRPW